MCRKILINDVLLTTFEKQASANLYTYIFREIPAISLSSESLYMRGAPLTPTALTTEAMNV